MSGKSALRMAVVLLLCLAGTLSASDGISWNSKSLSAGKVNLVDHSYQVRRVLGTANFSPEFSMPVELVYSSNGDTTGIFGYRWNCPQLESRVFPNKDGSEWITPWGEKITFFSKEGSKGK